MVRSAGWNENEVFLEKRQLDLDIFGTKARRFMSQATVLLSTSLRRTLVRSVRYSTILKSPLMCGLAKFENTDDTD